MRFPVRRLGHVQVEASGMPADGQVSGHAPAGHDHPEGRNAVISHSDLNVSHSGRGIPCQVHLHFIVHGLDVLDRCPGQDLQHIETLFWEQSLRDPAAA